MEELFPYRTQSGTASPILQRRDLHIFRLWKLSRISSALGAAVCVSRARSCFFHRSRAHTLFCGYSSWISFDLTKMSTDIRPTQLVASMRVRPGCSSIRGGNVLLSLRQFFHPPSILSRHFPFPLVFFLLPFDPRKSIEKVSFSLTYCRGRTCPAVVS